MVFFTLSMTIAIEYFYFTQWKQRKAQLETQLNNKVSGPLSEFGLTAPGVVKIMTSVLTIFTTQLCWMAILVWACVGFAIYGLYAQYTGTLINGKEITAETQFAYYPLMGALVLDFMVGPESALFAAKWGSKRLIMKALSKGSWKGWFAATFGEALLPVFLSMFPATGAAKAATDLLQWFLDDAGTISQGFILMVKLAFAPAGSIAGVVVPGRKSGKAAKEGGKAENEGGNSA